MVRNAPHCAGHGRRASWHYRLAAVVIGMLFCLYLVFREIVTLGGRICADCTSVPIITFLLFALIVFGAAGYRPPDSPARSR
jgi:uncharacterized membrane protein